MNIALTTRRRVHLVFEDVGVGIGASTSGCILLEYGVDMDDVGTCGNAFGVTILLLRLPDDGIWPDSEVWNWIYLPPIVLR